MSSEQLLHDGDLAGALEALQGEVRGDPSNPAKRTFLFQLLALLGQWERAQNQLNVLAEMDPKSLMMVQAYRAALQAEALRAGIYEGKHTPLVFGEPEQWIALVIQALQVESEGHAAEARQLRDEAFEAAPATAGEVDGSRFEWIADGDIRLGPIVEALVDGKLFWIPFHRIRQIELEPPADLRDLIWAQARFTWANGGQAVGLIPVRYPGSEASDDDQVRLARKTTWTEIGEGHFHGRGQRMLSTDADDFPLLDVRQLQFEPTEE